MSKTSLSADCARCAALCCVAFAFDASDQFAGPKAAGSPCAHLTGCGRCAIHRARAARGYSGCVGYDCHGAGPWVTQVLFGGRTWRDDPALAGPMSAAFIMAERAHGLLLLLNEAQRLPLSTAERGQAADLWRAIEDSRGSEADVAALGRETQAFLRRLCPYVTALGGTK